MSKDNALPVWKDTTSYSQGKERIPSCWSINLGGLHLSVLTGHLYEPDNWVIHCDPWFRTFPIGPKSMDVDSAQRKALDLVGQKLESARAALLKAGGGEP